MKNTSKRKKINLIPIPFIITFLVILGVSLYANLFISFSMKTMEYNIEHRLIAESKRLANLVNAQELDKFRAIADMELSEYKTLRLKLLDFSRDAEVLYAYFIRPVTQDKYQYIIDNDFNEETRVGLDTKPFDPRPLPWILSTLEGKAVCSGLGNYTPGWEGLLSGYAPVFDIDGNVIAIAGVDIEDKPIVQASHLVSVLTLVQIIAIIIIFSSGVVYFVYLKRQTEIARNASAAKSEFLVLMSHEMKTPLTVITTDIQLAENNIEENKEEAKMLLQDAWQETMRLADHVTKMLAFTRNHQLINDINIAELKKDDVTLTSETGKGTTVRLLQSEKTEQEL